MRTALFSIVSPNYRHFARILMDSARRHHPDWDRFVVLVGGEPVPEELFTTVPLSALRLPQERKFCFRYTVLELNTAVKPWMFAHLFARGYDRVVYLDPDIYLYAPLAELSDTAFLTLTPHLTGFIGGDEQHPSERSILLAGAYNLGFLAVTRHRDLDRFLGWWQEKLEYQCIVDTANGRFVDQKWIDLAPGLFADVAILRHDGYNVAYWNLRQRSVRGNEVNGQPLRFFHFSGFDASSTELLSRHDVLRLDEIGDAKQLALDYAAALRGAGYAEFRNARYGFGYFADGTRITDAVRIAYRNSPELQAAAGDDPFQHPDLFRGIRDPQRGLSVAKLGVQSYRLLSRARIVVRLFPHPLRAALRDFLLGRRGSAPPPSRPRTSRTAGLNVIGYFGRPTGVGESARLCERSAIAAGIAVHAVDVDTPGSQVQHRASIFHVNADQTLLVQQHHAQLFPGDAYAIGCWHWELPELPDAWIASAEPLDELWAPSAFIQATLSAKLSIPVVHMPHGIEITELQPVSLAELGIPPGRFVFLCMFDLHSVVERKNPMGAIDAFRRAFPRASADAALLIKTNRGTSHAADYDALAEELRGVPNVYLTDRLFTRAQTNGLIAACDGIVSLHRSEGFGLILAEGMAMGKPVVATGWSGNMEFMNAGNSCPVAYELVELGRNYHLYHAGNRWAEPDVEHAAQSMRRLVQDDAWRAQIGARARATMRADFSLEAAGQRYRKRLQLLGLLGGN